MSDTRLANLEVAVFPETTAVDSAMAKIRSSLGAIRSSFSGLRLRVSSSDTNSFSSLSRSIASPIANIEKLKSSLGGLKGMFVSGLGIGAGVSAFRMLATAIVSPFTNLGQAILDSSNVEIVERKFNNVFGSMAESASKFAKDYAAQLGQSETDIKRVMSRMQDTLVPLGFDRKIASNMTQSITKLATDLAANEGISMEDAATRITAGMTGEFESWKLFGVVVHEAHVQAELLRMGIMGGTKAATDQQKVIARLNLLYRGTKDAQGSAAKSAGTFANELSGFRAMITQLSATIGNIFKPAATTILKFLRESLVSVNTSADTFKHWGTVLNKAVSSVIERLKPITAFIPAIAAFVPTFAAIAVAIGGAVAGLVALAATITSIGTIFGVLSAAAMTAFGLITAGISALLTPIGLVVAAIVGIGGYMTYAALESTGSLEKLGKMFGDLSTTATGAWSAITAAIASGDIELAGQIAFTALEIAWLTLTTAMQDVWSGVSDFFVNTWRSAVGSIIDLGSEIYFGTAKYFDQLSTAFKDGFMIASTYILGAVAKIQNEIAKSIISGQELFGLMSAEDAQGAREILDKGSRADAQIRQKQIDTNLIESGKGLEQRDQQRRETKQQFDSIIDEEFAPKETKTDTSALTAAQERLGKLREDLVDLEKKPPTEPQAPELGQDIPQMQQTPKFAKVQFGNVESMHNTIQSALGGGGQMALMHKQLKAQQDAPKKTAEALGEVIVAKGLGALA